MAEKYKPPILADWSPVGLHCTWSLSDAANFYASQINFSFQLEFLFYTVEDFYCRPILHSSAKGGKGRWWISLYYVHAGGFLSIMCMLVDFSLLCACWWISLYYVHAGGFLSIMCMLVDFSILCACWWISLYYVHAGGFLSIMCMLVDFSLLCAWWISLYYICACWWISLLCWLISLLRCTSLLYAGGFLSYAAHLSYMLEDFSPTLFSAIGIILRSSKIPSTEETYIYLSISATV